MPVAMRTPVRRSLIARLSECGLHRQRAPLKGRPDLQLRLWENTPFSSARAPADGRKRSGCGFLWLSLGAFARASCGQSRSSSGRSRSSAPRSMSATRSSTIAMWSRALERMGAVFVESLDEIPDGAVTIFSAHGVAQSIIDEAKSRGLPVLDATCPLVSKVHIQGKRYVARGRTLILIGHAGHPEVEGTIGQVGAPVHLVSTVEDVARLDLPDDAPVAYVTQTTLSVDDTRGVIAALQARFSDLAGPGRRRTSATPRSIASRRCGNCAKWWICCWSWAAEQLQLQSPARDRCRARTAQPSDRRRQRARSGMAGRGRDRRPDRRRLGARGTGARRHRGPAPAWRGRGRANGRRPRRHRVPAAQGAQDAVGARPAVPSVRVEERRRGNSSAAGGPHRRLCARASIWPGASATRWC